MENDVMDPRDGIIGEELIEATDNRVDEYPKFEYIPVIFLIGLTGEAFRVHLAMGFFAAMVGTAWTLYPYCIAYWKIRFGK